MCLRAVVVATEFPSDCHCIKVNFCSSRLLFRLFCPAKCADLIWFLQYLFFCFFFFVFCFVFIFQRLTLFGLGFFDFLSPPLLPRCWIIVELDKYFWELIRAMPNPKHWAHTRRHTHTHTHTQWHTRSHTQIRTHIGWKTWSPLRVLTLTLSISSGQHWHSSKQLTLITSETLWTALSKWTSRHAATIEFHRPLAASLAHHRQCRLRWWRRHRR